jgi:hypothetical protein
MYSITIQTQYMYCTFVQVERTDERDLRARQAGAGGVRQVGTYPLRYWLFTPLNNVPGRPCVYVWGVQVHVAFLWGGGVLRYRLFFPVL